MVEKSYQSSVLEAITANSNEHIITNNNNKFNNNKFIMDTSKRNRYAGKHPSYKKRKMTKDQIAKKRAYQKEYNKTESARKHRSELNKENRKRGTYGNGDKKDVSHSSDGKKTKLESQSKNRARKTGAKQSKTPRRAKKK